MTIFIRYLVFLGLAFLAIILGVVLGDYGPWYLSWLLGTGLMVLVAALGGVLYEAQEEAQPHAELQAAGARQDKPPVA